MRKFISKQSPIVSYRSLYKESDKGCVLIVGTILEEHLRQLHEAHIAAHTTSAKKNIFKDLCQPHAPLSTFSSVIKIAFAYGLIPTDDYEELEIVRRLRNEAAHTICDFSLEDDGIKDLVLRLRADERMPPNAVDAKSSPAGTANLTLPKITKVKRHFLVNSLTLNDSILEKLEKEFNRCCPSTNLNADKMLRARLSVAQTTRVISTLPAGSSSRSTIRKTRSRFSGFDEIVQRYKPVPGTRVWLCGLPCRTLRNATVGLSESG